MPKKFSRQNNGGVAPKQGSLKPCVSRADFERVLLGVKSAAFDEWVAGEDPRITPVLAQHLYNLLECQFADEDEGVNAPEGELKERYVLLYTVGEEKSYPSVEVTLRTDKDDIYAWVCHVCISFDEDTQLSMFVGFADEETRVWNGRFIMVDKMADRILLVRFICALETMGLSELCKNIGLGSSYEFEYPE